MSQEWDIFFYLGKGKTLTALQALKKFGCLRLAARIKDLRKSGHKIKTTMIDYGHKRVAKYSLTTTK